MFSGRRSEGEKCDIPDWEVALSSTAHKALSVVWPDRGGRVGRELMVYGNKTSRMRSNENWTDGTGGELAAAKSYSSPQLPQHKERI